MPTARVLAELVTLGGELLAETAEAPGPRVAAARALLDRVLHPTGARLSSLVDTDARVGHKAPKRTFVGYKLHVAEDTSEIVTTVQALPGNVHEGSRLPELLAEEERRGIRQPAVVADKLYDSARNRALVQRLGATAHIPRRQRLKVAVFQSPPTTCGATTAGGALVRGSRAGSSATAGGAECSRSGTRSGTAATDLYACPCQ